MFKILTKFPIAFKSLDHIDPFGTKRDNSRHPYFEYLLKKLMDFNSHTKIVDFGCSGGGFISHFHDSGYLSIGIEGSDYSLKSNRAEWFRLKNKVLFTADLSKDFKILYDDSNILFDTICAFEFLEHLSYQDLEIFVNNIKNISHTNTIYIFSIGLHESKYHQTVKDSNWWIDFFKKYNLIENKKILNYFNNRLLRDDTDFNLILTDKNAMIDIPNKTFYEKIFGVYVGLKLYNTIKKFLHLH